MVRTQSSMVSRRIEIWISIEYIIFLDFELKVFLDCYNYIMTEISEIASFIFFG